MHFEEEIYQGKKALSAGLINANQFHESMTLFRELDGQVSFLAILIQRGSITMEQARRLQNQSEQVGQVGDYQLLDKLGEGGMGAVYKALHLPSRQMRALKILLPQVARDDEMIRRFIQEGQATRLLNHPGVVKCYEVKRWNTTYYMAMELVLGLSLDQYLQRQPILPEEKALTICKAVAEALEEAWNHKIIHRDIKPENILISQTGQIKLTDFGLAKLKNHKGASLTQTGVFMGTPWFISPEQARGDRDIDTRSDIYSLGITLFQMATGRLPFESKSALVVCQKHLNEPLPHPRQFNPKLSQPMVQLIKKMTAKKAVRRPQNPEELLSLIHSVAHGTFPQIHRESSILTAIRAGQPTTPSKGKWIVTFLVLLFALSGSWFFWEKSKAPSQKKSIQHQFLHWKSQMEVALSKGGLEKASRLFQKGKSYRAWDAVAYDRLGDDLKGRFLQVWKAESEKWKDQWERQEGFVFTPHLLPLFLRETRQKFKELSSLGGLSKLKNRWERLLARLSRYGKFCSEKKYRQALVEGAPLFSTLGNKGRETLQHFTYLQKSWEAYQGGDFQPKALPKLSLSIRTRLAGAWNCWFVFGKATLLFSRRNWLSLPMETIKKYYWYLLRQNQTGLARLKTLLPPAFRQELKALFLLMEAEIEGAKCRFSQGLLYLEDWEKKYSPTLLFQRARAKAPGRKILFRLLARYQEIMQNYSRTVQQNQWGKSLESYGDLGRWMEALAELKQTFQGKNIAGLMRLLQCHSHALDALHTPLWVTKKPEAFQMARALVPSFGEVSRFLRTFYGDVKSFTLDISRISLPERFYPLVTDLWMFVALGELLKLQLPLFQKNPPSPTGSSVIPTLELLQVLSHRKKKKSLFYQCPFLYSSLLSDLLAKIEKHLARFPKKNSTFSASYILPRDLMYFQIQRKNFRFLRFASQKAGGIYGGEKHWRQPLIKIFPGRLKKLELHGYYKENFQFLAIMERGKYKICIKISEVQSSVWTLAFRVFSREIEDEKIIESKEFFQTKRIKVGNNVENLQFEFLHESLNVSIGFRKVARFPLVLQKEKSGKTQWLRMYFKKCGLLLLKETLEYNRKHVETSLGEVRKIWR